MPTRNALALQKWVLDSVSAVLGGESYEWEWKHEAIVNPKSGYRFRFDGCFVPRALLVEVHGIQHFKYIPYWHKSEAGFEARQQMEALKLKQAEALGFKVLVIRYDEPFTDPVYLAGRLVEMGVLEPGDGAARG